METLFNGVTTDYTQINGQGSGNSLEYDLAELAAQGFDCRGKELEIYMGSNAPDATQMRAQLWDKDFNAQILPYVDLPQNDAYVSMGVVPADANIGALRFYPNNVSMRATCYHIRIGGKHVYSGGPYFPALTFPVGTEMGSLVEGDEIQQGNVWTFSSDNMSAAGTFTQPYNGAFDGNSATITECSTGFRLAASMPAGQLAFDSPQGITVNVLNPQGGQITQTNIAVDNNYTTILQVDEEIGFLEIWNSSAASVGDNYQCRLKGIRWNGIQLVDGPIGTTGTVGSITNTTVQLNSSEGTWTNGETVTGPERQPTGTVASTSGTTANLQQGTNTGGWVNGVNVTGAAVIPYGIVGSVDEAGASVTLSSSNDAWIDGAEVSGPLKDKVEANTTKYLKFDNSGNVTELLDAPQDPAYETDDENPSLTLTFPSTFGSGLTPDEELGAGTTLTVEATASNSAGTSATKSAEVMPEGDPGCALGGLVAHPGTGGLQDIVNGVDLVNNDGLVWIKQRDETREHYLFDTKRGAENYLFINNTSTQGNDPNTLQSFETNGFKLGNSVNVNGNPGTYVAWTFQQGEGFFDIVKQNVEASDTIINHSLGRNPTFIIGRPINTADNYYC